MPHPTRFLLATRGSALALAQANLVLAECQSAFPKLEFALKIIKTTGDKLQTAALAHEGQNLPKGLFTKELESALLKGHADMAVHSLKDLPTQLPPGLTLGAVGKRGDVRDVLVYRSSAHAWPGGTTERRRRAYGPALELAGLPPGAVVASSSTRRRAQLLLANPALTVVDIRGNVATRMQKLADREDLDATLLALAGIQRLNYRITPEGQLEGGSIPGGLLATILDTSRMLPCVGQGAIGLEIREGDERMTEICRRLNDTPTFQCVTAERAFLAAMGGGCQSPVAAHAQVAGSQIVMRAVSFAAGPVRRAEGAGPVSDPVGLGQRLAAELKH